MKKEITVKIEQETSELQIKKIAMYLNNMPIQESLFGLKFAKNRWDAKDAGILVAGRKSIVQKEVEGITSEQANWRIKNWKIMIANYRKRGYSYPTISRIKKILIEKQKLG